MRNAQVTRVKHWSLRSELSLIKQLGNGPLLLVLAIILYAGPAWSASNCGEDALQESGSIYRICMPPAAEYNGNLVIWAHGYQDATESVQIPEDQLSFGGFHTPEIVNDLGFGFATNSYSKTGLAVRQGMEDLLDLVEIFALEQGAPENIYIIGASEGGLITTLLVEQYPDIFTAGLAVCGPVGHFPYQINYFGDARATFEYFFRELIPGDPFKPSTEFINTWPAFYETSVKPVIFDPSNRRRLDQWVLVAKLPFDENNYLETVEESVRDVLRYSVVNVNDAAATLGGFPFDNHAKWYSGSNNDLLLNIFVPRRSADPAAVDEMLTFYNTSGQLQSPLVTLHTRQDQQVPFPHEVIYNLKTLISGSLLVHHINIPVERYGHCNFTPGEALVSLALMLLYGGDLDTLIGVGSVLQGAELNEFEELAESSDVPFQVEGETLEVLKRH